MPNEKVILYLQRAYALAKTHTEKESIQEKIEGLNSEYDKNTCI